MIDYKPVALKLGQQAPPMPVGPASVPPPSPDPLYTGYTGFPGIVETLAVLAITSTAAVLGVTTGLDKSESQTTQVMGWVSGVGSALLGILYIAGKAGLNQSVGLPAMRVTPN